MHKFNHIRQVASLCLHGRTHCRHLANTIEPSVYGGDAPDVKLPYRSTTYVDADYCCRRSSVVCLSLWL